MAGDEIPAAALAAAFAAGGRPFPQALSLEPLAGGSINRSFRLRAREGDYFCKWNPGAPADMFLREKEGLEALAAAGASLIIPRVVGLSPGDAQVSPVLVLEYLEPARAPGSRATWERLGRGLAELHRRVDDAFGFGADNYCGSTPQANARGRDWAEFYAARRIGPLVERLDQDHSLTGSGSRNLHKLMEKLPALLGHGPAASLIHGDLWSGNFLDCAAGPALIDPAAYHGDREAEWGMMLLFGGFPEAVLAAYQEAWPLPAGWRERIPLYQLYHILNHYLLFGGSYGGQALRIVQKYL